jgi:hypothetical protein
MKNNDWYWSLLYVASCFLVAYLAFTAGRMDRELEAGAAAAERDEAVRELGRLKSAPPKAVKAQPELEVVEEPR